MPLKTKSVRNGNPLRTLGCLWAIKKIFLRFCVMAIMPDEVNGCWTTIGENFVSCMGVMSSVCTTLLILSKSVCACIFSSLFFFCGGIKKHTVFFLLCAAYLFGFVLRRSSSPVRVGKYPFFIYKIASRKIAP